MEVGRMRWSTGALEANKLGSLGLILALLGMTAPGCFYHPPSRRMPIESVLPHEGPMPRFTQDEEARADVPSPYRIQHPDKLELEVRDLDEFNGSLLVDRKGAVRLPGLEKDVLLAGMTVDQAEKRIAEVLAPYVRSGLPDARLRLSQPQSQFFYAYGAVGQQGRFVMGEQTITLRDALLTAGLFRPGGAPWMTYVISPHPTDPTHVVVDARDLLLGRTQENLLIHPSDVIYVPTSGWTRYTQVLNEVLGQVYNGMTVDALYQFLEQRLGAGGAETVGGRR